MRTVSIRLGNRIARALCDTGSTYSLMSTRLAKSIPHQVIGKKKLRIQTFGSIIEEEFTVIRVIAEGVMCSMRLSLDVLVSDAVVGSFEKLDTESVRIFHSHFGEAAVLADIPGDNADPLDIIIGEDYYDQIVVGRPVVITGGLKATLTIFGWMLHGNGTGSQSSVHFNTAYVFKASVQEQSAEFWNIEHLGVSTGELHNGDLEGDIRSSLTRDESKCHLASNKAVSERSLQKLLDSRSADDYKAYHSEVQNLLDGSYIEKFPGDEVPQSYLPHSGVVKASSATTKLRIVYDASTKSEEALMLAVYFVSKRSMPSKWIGDHEQFLIPPRETAEEQRDFVASDEIQLRKSYYQQLSAIWETEYVYQVLGAKGDGDKRPIWKLGVVKELHVSRDQRCRAGPVTVRVHNGLLRRPIQKSYKLELGRVWTMILRSSLIRLNSSNDSE